MKKRKRNIWRFGVWVSICTYMMILPVSALERIPDEELNLEVEDMIEDTVLGNIPVEKEDMNNLLDDKSGDDSNTQMNNKPSVRPSLNTPIESKPKEKAPSNTQIENKPKEKAPSNVQIESMSKDQGTTNQTTDTVAKKEQEENKSYPLTVEDLQNRSSLDEETDVHQNGSSFFDCTSRTGRVYEQVDEDSVLDMKAVQASLQHKINEIHIREKEFKKIVLKNDTGSCVENASSELYGDYNYVIMSWIREFFTITALVFFCMTLLVGSIYIIRRLKNKRC